MSYHDRLDDTRPHPRLRMIQRTTPFVSWGSFLGVLGIVVTLIAGYPARIEGAGSGPSAQQVQSMEQQLQDHAQKIHDTAAVVQDLRDSNQRLIQGQQDEEQQISDLDYKTTRILELMLERGNAPPEKERH